MRAARFPALFLSLALSSLALLAPPASGASCAVHRQDFAFDTPLLVQIFVPSGTDCEVRFPLPAAAVIDVNEITAPPRYGGARVHGLSGAYYRSNPGYRGPDQFAFAFCGRDGTRPACARVRVRVDVR